MSVRLAQNGHARHSKLRDVALVKKSKSKFSVWKKLKLFIYSRWQCGVHVCANVSEGYGPQSLSLRISHTSTTFYFAAFCFVGAAEEKRRKQDAEWEKYLISCYTQSKK